jgi:hypothetical protein
MTSSSSVAAPGEHCAAALARGGLRVAVVERELVGGECSYWARIPSKTLLRPGEAVYGAREAAATAEGDVEAALAWRDFMVSDYSDPGQERFLAGAGIDLLRGSGRLARPGVVEVGGVPHTAEHVVVATGSDPIVPPVPGPARAPGHLRHPRGHQHGGDPAPPARAGRRAGGRRAGPGRTAPGRRGVQDRHLHTRRRGVGRVPDPAQRRRTADRCLRARSPEAGEWLQQATLAIRARVPLGVLHDTIQLFPSFSEIYATALRALEGAVAATGQPVSRGLSGCERDALDLLAPRDNDV